MSNKGLKYDAGKVRYDLVEPFVEESLASVLTFGAIEKGYGERNWMNVEPFQDRYYAALRRHIAEWRNGNVIDSESGRHHLAHALCNIYFLMWKDIQDGKWTGVHKTNI